MKRKVVVSLLSSVLTCVVLLLIVANVGAQGPDGGTPQPIDPAALTGTPISATFTYQGQLKSGGSAVNGLCDLQFGLWDAANGGAQVGVTQTLSAVNVANGLFTVPLNFGTNAFTGDARWLGIAVRCPAGSGPYALLDPRQALTPTPYANRALDAGALQGHPVNTTPPLTGQVLKWDGSAWMPGADLTGGSGNIYSNGFGLNLIGNVFSVLTDTIQARVSGACGAGLAMHTINVDGSVTCGPISTNFWGLTGSAGTNPLTNFLGTTDNVSLTLRVNNIAAFRIIPNATSPNIIGGYSGNFISATVAGSVIGGGGVSGSPNRVQASYATVAGGANNTASSDFATVGGGIRNLASGGSATIGGGLNNTASGPGTSVSGGYNTASNWYATVAGGDSSTASGDHATIGGGGFNTASAYAATVPGGYLNAAAGDYSFAAGRRAKANHPGAFVWGDSTDADVSSTGSDQFVVRASGGVSLLGVGAVTQTQLTVAGLISTTGGVKFPDSTTQTTAFYRPTLPGPGAATTVDSAGAVGPYTSITIGADGLGLISYYDGTTDGDLKVFHCSNTACSNGLATTVDSPGAVGRYTSITIGADGLGLISYYDATTDGDLKVFHCSNTACSSGLATTVDSAGAVGTDTSTTIGADGLGLISYRDAANGDLKVLHCGNAACSSSNTATTVDSTGDVGYFTSITIGGDALGLIGYYDITNGDLKVLHCGNAACNNGNIFTTVDGTGDVGRFTSITIGPDGLGLISYYTLADSALKVLHCGNAACNNGNTATIVDNAGVVGGDTSITIGADGLGLISYYDSTTDGDLKVFRCSNFICKPYTRVGR